MAKMDTQVLAGLSRFRDSVDNFDAALIHILAERFRCTQQIGRYKAENNLPAADPGREEKQLRRLRKLAEECGLEPNFAESFFRLVVNEVVRQHEVSAKQMDSQPN